MARFLTLLTITLLAAACGSTPPADPSPAPAATSLSAERPAATISVGEVIELWVADGPIDVSFSPDGIVELVSGDEAGVETGVGFRGLTPGTTVITVVISDGSVENYTLSVVADAP